MKHGMFRASKLYPKGPQIEALQMAGVKRKPTDHVFDWHDREETYRTMRRGDVVCVVGLDKLGEDPQDMIATCERLAAKGVRVLNVETGRHYEPGDLSDLETAHRRWRGERVRQDDSHYRKLSKARKGKPLVMWAISFEEAAKVWRDLGISTNAEAAAEISRRNIAAGGRTITVNQLQRKFKGSKRPAGWRRGVKKNAE